MVQLPLVIAPGVVLLVTGDGLPAVDPDAAMPKHLEVLGFLGRLGSGIREGIGEALPADRKLAVSGVLIRRGGVDSFQDCRQYVADVVELPANAAPLGNASGPMRDHRYANASAVGVLLVPLQRRVAGLGPAPGIVGRTARTANLVQPRLRPRQRRRAAVGHSGRYRRRPAVPPSWLAPLSAISSRMVLSSCPDSSR